MKEPMYYRKVEDSKVHCCLCPHNCVIKPGQTGACRARQNQDGLLYSLNFERVASLSLDPIEKKPLKIFLPGSMILSAGTSGCNLKCSFCQNHSISHNDPTTYYMPAEALVTKAYELREEGNLGIAFTYNEPSIWFEYVLESSRLAKEKALVNVLVTNGFINKDPLLELIPYIDAMNIDVKAFTEKFYSRICKANLKSVKDTVMLAAEKCHVEVTTLVIPGLNDSVSEIEELCRWLSSISPEIPLHLSRFFPNYKMIDKPITPVETLMKARDVALKYLKYVYIGNV